MAAELLASLGIFKTMFDMVKGLKDINDAAVRNGAAIELQEKILTAQAQQSALVECVNELEKDVAGFETWNAEKERYQLKDFGGNTFAYELKQAEARGEPIHRICPACYERRHKSIHQSLGRNAYSQDMYICPGCKTEFKFGNRQQPRKPMAAKRSDYY